MRHVNSRVLKQYLDNQEAIRTRMRARIRMRRCCVWLSCLYIALLLLDYITPMWFLNVLRNSSRLQLCSNKGTFSGRVQRQITIRIHYNLSPNNVSLWNHASNNAGTRLKFPFSINSDRSIDRSNLSPSLSLLIVFSTFYDISIFANRDQAIVLFHFFSSLTLTTSQR